MKIISKKILCNVAILSAVVVVIVNVTNNISQEGSEADVNKELTKTTLSSNQLSSDIDGLTSSINELKRRSKTHSQDDIKNKFNNINNKLAALRDQFDSLSNIVTVNPSYLGESESEKTLLSEEEEIEAMKIQVKEQIDVYENIAAEEGVDQEWAANAQANIYESFNNLSDSGIGVSDVKCHSSLCQVAFYIEEEHSDDALQKLQNIAPWEDGESFIWIEDIEQGEGAIYLSREGDKLPIIDG